MENTNSNVSFDIKNAKLALNSISVYRNLLKDKVVNSLYLFLNYADGEKVELDHTAELYNNFFFNLSESGTNSLKEYIINKILFDENAFSRIEKHKNIEDAAANDLKKLQFIASLKGSFIKDRLLKIFDKNKFKNVIEEFPQWGEVEKLDLTNTPEHIKLIKESLYNSDNWNECIYDLKKFHQNYGCGIFAFYRAFVWEYVDGKSQFKCISNPDPVELSDFIGYENERKIVIENTVQFLKGFPSNNVLLYGDRGTGKSSTVKAILNKYYKDGLRMIELPKAHIIDFPDIIRQLKDKPQKFIIFIDDLVFGDNEESYTALKSILEGGIESKSRNILIYATSNRRHLVKEYFSDRDSAKSQRGDGEIHYGDSRQEKLSLADRFGINVLFSSPDKKRYLEIVDGIADKRKLKIDRKTLHREAVKWEMWYNGPSARTAVQFIDWIEGKNKIENK